MGLGSSLSLQAHLLSPNHQHSKDWSIFSSAGSLEMQHQSILSS
jgi:hypothetical protein